VGDYSRPEAAERAGVSVGDINQLVDLGILQPSEGDLFSIGDVRRMVFLQGFVAAGIPLEGLATQMRKGNLSIAAFDSPAFDAFASLTPVTFAELSDQTGVPVDLLMVIREAIGSALPTPDDRVREDEMAIVPLIEAQREGWVQTFDHRARAASNRRQHAACRRGGDGLVSHGGHRAGLGRRQGRSRTLGDCGRVQGAIRSAE